MEIGVCEHASKEDDEETDLNASARAKLLTGFLEDGVMNVLFVRARREILRYIEEVKALTNLEK
jgi:hypothetical protein